MMSNNVFDRDQTVQIIRRWGALTTDALLDPLCQFFILPDIEGLIGYQIHDGCAIVFGNPVCRLTDRPALTHAFHAFCKEHRLRVVYLMVSDDFVQWSLNKTCRVAIHFGDELTLDPQVDPRSLHGTHASLVRRKLRHGTNEGVIVKEYIGLDPALESTLNDVGAAWLNNRQGPQIHISRVYLFEDRMGKRWFYAKHHEKIVGVIVLNSLENRQGWLINHLMIAPEAPGGTPELLVVTALDTLKNEGCTYATFGVAPNDKLGETIGLGKISAWAAPLVYRLAYRFFSLQGLNMFWGKFDPQRTPSYLLFASPTIGYREIAALRKTLCQ